MGYKVEAGISNKHLHLSAADLAALYGEGYELTKFKDLKQPGQYAAEEKVDIIGPKGEFKGVRILGPTRPETQVEISLTDARALGVKPPVRESGKLEGTPGIKLVGPAGSVDISEGTIVALRHVHLSPAQAAEAGVADKEIVRVAVNSGRPLVFDEVLIRSGDGHTAEFHVDTDEANAAALSNGDEVEIVKKG
ncbi:MAG: phosphate propanoyltransferase [Clostridiales Family XIII bacterium]|nr:phosphate propanoyltransferase [Clostridiales Family XIII bacterium]